MLSRPHEPLLVVDPDNAQTKSFINNNLGGLQFYEDEARNKYAVGADSVPKKLGSTLYYLGKTRQNVSGGKPSSTSTTFNVSAINGYKDFTVANFIASAQGYGLSIGGAGYYASTSKSYNPNTGILTVNTPAQYFSQIDGYTFLMGIDVYLCIGDIVNL